MLSKAQVVRLIDAGDPADRFHSRDKAIMELLYASGLRASELCGLKTVDISFNTNWLRVVGKGGHERMVPFGKPAAAAMLKYARDLRPLLDRQQRREEFFVSRSGRRISVNERRVSTKPSRRSARCAG